MSRDSRRNKQGRAHRSAKPESPSLWTGVVPVLVLVVLNLPTLRLGYYWDDFYFLTFTAQGNAFVLPDPHFFRPIPLGLYFKILRFLDPTSGMLAHILNLALLAGVVLLLVRLVSQLSGASAGLFAGLVFAGYGHVSSLVAWISSCTDLLAILFVTAAFLLRHQRRDFFALGCATLGLLCKESAISAFPALVLWDWLVGRSPKRPLLQVTGYAAVATVWALIHPGIRGLFQHGFLGGSAAYVGSGSPELWGTHLVRYLLTLLNVPPPGLASGWLDDRVFYATLAVAVAAIGLYVMQRRLLVGAATPFWRVAILSASFWVPAVLMPTLLVRHWAPYLACLPALGAAIVLGTLFAKQPRLVAIGLLALFLILGARSRGIRGVREPVLSEPLMVEASEAMRTLRANVHEVFPSFPRGSQVVGSVATSGLRGVQGALFEGQALSLWYRDPTLRTVRIMDRRHDSGPEFLVRVTDDLDVIAIDPSTGQTRSSEPRPPRLAELDSPLRSYARAVAAGGDTDRAIQVMRSLSRKESTESSDLVAHNDRIIASMLLADGREREADSILAVTPSFPVEVSRGAVLRVLSNPSPSEALDMAAFAAFGLSASDPETLRWLTRALWDAGARAQAAWLAQRLQQLVPGDVEAQPILDKAATMGIEPNRKLAFRRAAEGA